MDVAGRMIHFPTRLGEQRGYLVEPQDGRPHPGAVVIQEWWGLDAHIQEVTRRLAAEGYVALAPDLYDGQVARDPERAMALMTALPVEDGVEKLVGAVEALVALDRVEPKRVAVVGFCMGGSYALELALRSPRIAAVAPFYPGRIGALLDRLPAIRVPMFVPFGGADASIPLAVVDRFRETAQRAGMDVEIKVYPGCDHAFHNDTAPVYNEAAAKDAWARTLLLFARALTPA
ncbi:MAG: dienelactone hydrolase family protein [Actinomycetia bacterium]|nr:dienelactone hydrolase family protein [Actinomycetes bacterium]